MGLRIVAETVIRPGRGVYAALYVETRNVT